MASGLIVALAHELRLGYATGMRMPTLTSRHPGFDLGAAYAVQAEMTRLRRAEGRVTVGRKVGYANRAMWRALKLDTLVWAHMYDDTVVHAGRSASLAVSRLCSPKVEPEIVFRLREPVDVSNPDPAAILHSVEWLALGFEIVDCVFADWTFQPADFVAALGLHAALVVGEPMRLEAPAIPALVEQLAQFRVQLTRSGRVVAEGSGRNALRSPVLALGALAAAIPRRPGEEPLLGGELVSSGTLTDPQFVSPGETWRATVEGIDLASVTLTTTA